MAFDYYQRSSASLPAGDYSTRTPVKAAVTGKSLSIRSFTMTAADACSVAIVDDGGGALTAAAPVLTFAAAGTFISPVYAPGSFLTTVSKGVSIDSNDTHDVSCTFEFYVM